jgi:hypothetical protein
MLALAASGRAEGDLRARLDIDGIPVDRLVEEVYQDLLPAAQRRGVALQFRLIAWEPLVVAADRCVLADTLRDLTRYVLSSTEEGPVALVACPTHDDVGVMFENKNSTPARRRADLVTDHVEEIAQARSRIESMGGDLTEFWNERGGARVMVSLPQWV